MTPTRPSTRRTRIMCAVLAIVSVGLVCWGWVPTAVTNPACRLTNNAAWIGVEWTSTPPNPLVVADLAQQAATEHLHFLYPFTTYVKADGSWRYSYIYAKSFVSTFRQHNQQTKLLAWIGIPYSHVDFANPQTRARIVTFLSALVSEAGFDGLQINAEPLPNGDQHYLEFLRELHTALAPQHMLSVASLPYATAFEEMITPGNSYRWSRAYYRAVAQTVDQMVAMTYDSGAPTPALYRLWMREQVVAIRQSIADTAPSS